MSQQTEFTLEHTLISEAEALRLIGERRTRMGERVMDPKAQVVSEFVKSIRVPGYYPPLPELRQQLHKMTELMDEPPPPLARVEDLAIPGPAGDLPARLYAPTTERPLPALLYLHGGGWVQGDLVTHHGLCSRLAAWSGAIVVSLDYRLAPENKFPAAVDDCCAAFRWLQENGGTLGIDGARIAVGGDSAGGNLAIVVAQQAALAKRPVPAFQALIYPATDFTLSSPSMSELVDAPVIPRERLEWYATQYLEPGADKRDVRMSPLFLDDLTGQPPALIITAGFDPLREEARQYADRLKQAGVEVTYSEYSGQIHAFVSLTKAIPQGTAALTEVADYMRARFAG